MPYRIACVGIGGFAANYRAAALKLVKEGRVELPAVVEPHADRFPDAVEELQAAGVRILPDMDALFDACPDLDLVTIGTGLHLHYPLCMKALEAGVNVVMAKPSCVLVQHVDAMVEESKRVGRFVAIDFQHCFCDGSQLIKRAVAEGDLGVLRRITAKLNWARGPNYYARNHWAGRFKLGDVYVLDGPMNNPHAHYINNSLYFAAPDPAAFATPVTIRAELYHAHDIEGEDMACARALTDTGVEIVVISSLCAETDDSLTEITVEGDKGRAVWTPYTAVLEIDGREPIHHEGERGRSEQVVRQALDCLDTGAKPRVSVADTRGHVLFTNGAYESAGAIRPVPADLIYARETEGGATMISVRGIDALVDRCAADRRLFSEAEVPWAVPGRDVDLTGYNRFEMELPRM